MKTIIRAFIGVFFIELCINLGAQEKITLSSTGFETEDKMFSEPYIDNSEWRNTPIKHLYVHGGFKGTETRFSFYFPQKDKYEGRFFQYITPIPDNENLSQNAQTLESDKISFAIESGAYFVETNGGGALDFSNPMARDATIGAYRANAASAQFSRLIAMQFYGGNRPYGYTFGGSGGSLRTIGSIENTKGVWDGVVPYVMPTPMSIPNSFTMGLLAGRVLADKTDEIVDALAPGSEKSVFDALETEEQIAVYKEVTSLGLPPGAWRTGQGGSGLGPFALILPTILQIDASYFTDFWTKPGYEGYNPSSSLKEDRVQLVSKIVKIISAEEAISMGLKYDPFGDESRGLAANAWKALIQKDASGDAPVAVQMGKVPDNKSTAYDLIVNSGAVMGKKLNMQWIDGNIVILTIGNNDAIKELKVGDELKFDNSNILAVSYYHRHQVPGDDYYVYNQYKDAEGKAIYPQRPMLLGPMFAAAASGSVPIGKFDGKMIVIQNMKDGGAMPWHADWYRNKVKENVGAEVDKHFRVRFTEHANHGDYPSQPDPTHDIVYLGVLHQTLRDLSAWVEKGIEPASTNYKVENGQVILPEGAKKRGGIQPVITVKANGKERAEIKAGESVTLEAIIEVPKNTGKVVLAEWNFEGGKEFTAVDNIVSHYTDSSGRKVKVKTTYTFKTPGTYFPTLQGASEREGNLKTSFALIKNLGSARVVVK